MTATELRDRITAYLSAGGLFNPELANQEAVRDLLIDCRDFLSQPELTMSAEEVREACAKVCDGLTDKAARSKPGAMGQMLGAYEGTATDCAVAIRSLDLSRKEKA